MQVRGHQWAGICCCWPHSAMPSPCLPLLDREAKRPSGCRLTYTVTTHIHVCVWVREAQVVVVWTGEREPVRGGTNCRSLGWGIFHLWRPLSERWRTGRQS